jgi:hypothetical protein
MKRPAEYIGQLCQFMALTLGLADERTIAR